MRLVTTLLIALFAAAPPAAAGEPVAQASSKCDIRGKERRLGTTYVTSLTASGVSCSNAERLVKAYHACRRDHGGADGRCTRVTGYRCSERRESIPTQFDARATCTRGGRKVVQNYTQNT